MEEVNTDLFQVLERGDRRIQKLHDEAIVFVGLSRAGKSTGFNWTLNQPMVGKGGRNSYYINVVSQDPNVARIGANFGSVTLAPNVYVDYTSQVSIVDLPGFEDSRDYIGTIGVSYFLKVLFEKVRKVKFVIVFSEQRFTEETGAGIISTMNGFFEMFKMDLMTTPELKDQLFDQLVQSVGFLVTRSKEGEYHYEYMKELIEKMKDKTMVAPNKELIIKFLTKMSSQARIEEFKKANDSENPEKCTYIERWNEKMKWEYFDLNAIQGQLGESVIGGPFDKHFAKLVEEQRQMLTQAIKKKVSFYNQFSEVLNVFMSTFKSNWEIFLNAWKQQKVEHNYFQMKPLFSKIREFLDLNDVYGSENIVEIEFRISYEPQTLVKSIEKVLKIFDIIKDIGTNQNWGEFHQIMDRFSEKFAEMTDCLRSFASNEDEEKDVERLKFNLKTGFRAFKKLYELRQQSIHDVKQKLPDNLNDVCSEGKQEYFQMFINGLNSDLLPKALPTLALLEEYEILTQKYELENSDSKDPIHFSQIRSTVEIAKADILDRDGEVIKALHCYTRALIKQNEISILIENGVKTEEEKEPELNNIFYNKKDLIQKITKILIKLPEEGDFQLKMAALRLCQNHHMISQVREIYELILSSTSITPLARIDMYDNYANFLVQWALFEDAKTLLYKKLSIPRLNMDNQKDTARKIHDIIDQAQTMGDAAKMKLTNWKRVANDPDLDTQLLEILISVPIPKLKVDSQ